jgi:hydroxymethylpyrimidine pyrophosphatase-like HAD family hydrolase
MIFHVLASDYDGTLAENGRVADATLRALERVRESGRMLALVTGRTLPDLEHACPGYDRLFDVVVAENGAALFLPKDREIKTLGAVPEPMLLAQLEQRGVAFALGTSSIHTDAAAAEECLAAIRATGVDRTLIFNRGSLMLLPGGVAKGSGLEAALDAVGSSPHNAVGIGDGENDHPFLALCEYGVAVADAVPALRERADYVTRAPGPHGVVEFIEEHLLQDMPALVRRLSRHQMRVGESKGAPVTIPAHGTTLLVVGPSGAGKSTLARVLAERLIESGRSLCLIDPEGDYESLSELRTVVALGGKDKHALPTAQELEQLLRQRTSLVLNLSALPRAEKVTFGGRALSVVRAVRGATGMPHWVMIDEAHHLMPAEGSPAAEMVASFDDGLCLVTLEAKALPADVLKPVTTVASASLEEFQRATQALNWKPWKTRGEMSPLTSGSMVLAHDGSPSGPIRFTVDPRKSDHRRHIRKYAEGELPPDRSFYFRGPRNALNLRAANLVRFCELAEGVDEPTWEHHRSRGDYSTWIRDVIKDPELAQAAEAAEKASGLSPGESRSRLLDAVRQKYSV